MSYYYSKSNVHNLIDKSAEPVAIFAYEFGDNVNDDCGWKAIVWHLVKCPNILDFSYAV